MKDKEKGTSQSMFQLVLSDKTKPAQFRATTFFTTYILGEEKFRGLFGPADPTDERVTVAVSELAPSNNMIKVKGQVLTGWLSHDDLMKLQMAGDSPSGTSPAGPRSSKAA